MEEVQVIGDVIKDGDVIVDVINVQTMESLSEEGNSKPGCSLNGDDSPEEVSHITSEFDDPVKDGMGTPSLQKSNEDPENWRKEADRDTLIVYCKKTVGRLEKAMFGSGSKGRCIREGEECFTPSDFEAHCGRSASKDWRRSIKYKGQPLQSLIEEGFLQVHNSSCSCSICLDDDRATGPVRLYQQRKKRRRNTVQTAAAVKVNKRPMEGFQVPSNPGQAAITLPVSNLTQLSMNIPSLVIQSGPLPASSCSGNLNQSIPPTGTAQGTSEPGSHGVSPSDINTLPLEKAWKHMNQVLLQLEKDVASCRSMLETLHQRTLVEAEQQKQRHLQEKEDAISQAKLEVQMSSMKESSESFLVEVKEGQPADGATVENESLNPLLLSSYDPSLPAVASVDTPLGDSKKKCMNCNRDSEFECSGCHTNPYCSPFCQKHGWPSHRVDCGRQPPSPREETLPSTSQVPGYIFMLS